MFIVFLFTMIKYFPGTILERNYFFGLRVSKVSVHKVVRNCMLGQNIITARVYSEGIDLTADKEQRKRERPGPGTTFKTGPLDNEDY